MESLLARLKAGAANRRRTVWPGTQEAVELRVLTEQDRLEAGLAADRLFHDAGLAVSMANIQDYEAEKATQLLWRAVLDPSTGKQLTPDIVEFRRLLAGQGVKEQLVAELTNLDEECSPRIDAMPQEQFDALLLRVKKTPKTTLLSVSSISLLRRLILSLAGQPSSSPPGSGST